MKQQLRKLWLLALCALMSVASAWADGNVAKIGTTEYATLQEAFNAGGTITLLSDITLTSTAIVSNKTVTLDLNGKTITYSGNTIHNQKTLTVKDNVGGGKIISTGSFAISVNDNSTPTIGATGSSAKNFFIESVEGAIITGKHKGAKITINSGTLSASDNAVVAGNGSAGFGENTITIKGGTFNGGITTAGYVACGIYAPNNDTWKISGGTFNITGGAGIVQRAGTVNISGDVVFNVTGSTTGKVGDSRIVVPCAAVVFDSQANYPGLTETSITKISGGKFTADNGQSAVAYVANEGGASRIAISGGSFSSAVPETCLAEGYQAQTTANSDGTYGVTLQYEAKIGNTYYPTFTEAANAASANDIVVLLAKPANAYTMTSADKTLKVQKNGFSCTVTGYTGYEAKSSTTDGVTTYTQVEATFEITKSDNSKSYTNSFSLSQSGVTTIKLLKDYTSTSCLNCGSSMYKNQSVTLDLGGKTLSVNTSVKRNYCISVLHGCTLTIKNGTLSMNPTSDIKSNGIYIDGENSKVIIESDAIVNASGVSAVTIIGNATLESAGTLSATGSFAIAGNGSTGNGGYTVNITGGSVTSTDAPAIYHPNSGTVTISGGSITGATGIYQKSGTLNITGGAITGNGTKADYVHNGNGANATGDAVVIENCGYPGGAPVPTISGGTFTSTNAKAVASYAQDGYEAIVGFISGGSFNTNVNDLAASNKMAIQEGEKYVVYSVETTTNTDTAEEHKETMTVKDGDNTKQTITVSVTPTASESTSAGDVALNQVELSSVIQDVINTTDLGTGTTVNVSVELQVNATTKSSDISGDNKKITFDVKPQAIVKVNNTEKDPVDISNENLKDGAKFEFTLEVTGLLVDAGGQVKVVHKSSDSGTYPDETFMAVVTEKESKKYVTINTTHFSEFEVSNSTVSSTDDVVLTDGVTAYTITTEATVNSASYVRSFASERVGKYHAWLVPFDYTIKDADIENFDFFKINMIANAPNEATAADADKLWIFLDPVTTGTTLYANMPYVFKPKSAQAGYEFKTTSAMLKATTTEALISTETVMNKYSFYATYGNTTATETEPFYYVNTEGQICKGTTVTVGAYRWIIKVTDKSGFTYAPQLNLEFVEGDATSSQTTGIETHDAAKGVAENYYNLNGMEVKSPAKGIHIVKTANGEVRKVVVK